MRREFNKETDSRGNKDWRKPWRGDRKSSNFDSSCRNHGSCGYCEDNRTYQYKKARLDTKEQLDEWVGGTSVE